MSMEEIKQMVTKDQLKLLNAACRDLAIHLSWHGNNLSHDDWRHLISGTVLGWRMMPAYDRGQGAPGFIMLGGSSLKLTKAQCIEAIEIAFHIGDCPADQGLTGKPVDWCDVIKLARGIAMEAA